MPLVVSGAAGAAGGAAVARDALEERVGPRVIGAVVGGATAFGGGSSSRSSRSCSWRPCRPARPAPTHGSCRGPAAVGAATVIEHAALLPNQSALVLPLAMGARATLSVGGEPAVVLSREGIDASQGAGVLLAAYAGAPGNAASFPGWFWAFAARAARGDGARRSRRRGRRAAQGRACVARCGRWCRVRRAVCRRGVGRPDRGARVGRSDRRRRDARRAVAPDRGARARVGCRRGRARRGRSPRPERRSGSATPR